MLQRGSEGAGDEAAYQLARVIEGHEPTDWKPITTVGRGVREIRIREHGDQYRIIYIAALVDAIYVLHAFQKKTRQTSKQDIDLARRRLKSITNNYP